MPRYDIERHSGRVTAVFAHRFLLETETGPQLADLTAKGQMRCPVHIGDDVTIIGEKKPSEITIATISVNGAAPVVVAPRQSRAAATARPTASDPVVALQAAEKEGFTCIGRPRRKPGHFEQLAVKGVAAFELHIEPGGSICRERPIDPSDPKWAHEFA